MFFSDYRKVQIYEKLKFLGKLLDYGCAGDNSKSITIITAIITVNVSTGIKIDDCGNGP